MSKNSEISKDLDSDHNKGQRTGDKSAVDNNVNGHVSGSDKEGFTKPEQVHDTSTSDETADNQAVEEDPKPSDTPDGEAQATDDEMANPDETSDAINQKSDEPGVSAQTPQAVETVESEQEPETPGDKEETKVSTNPQETVEVPGEDQSQVKGGDEKPEAELKTATNQSDPKTPNENEEASPAKDESPINPWEEIDYKSLTKSELVGTIELLVKEGDPILANKYSRELKSRYDVLHKEERKKALDQFVSDGNDPDHFAYKFDDEDNRFDGAFKLIRDRKVQHIKTLERDRESNLKEKVSLLEELRALVDEEETTSSIQSVKKIQEKWKVLGPVPGQHVKTLWANYHALMDRYYDQRSIYFELKELDRKKNLEAKLELCEKAENLIPMENLKQAIGELNELHEEFKHIGPVPKAEQQALWDRFKQASDQIYIRRKEFIKHLKEDLKENLNKKEELAVVVQEYLQFNSDRITDWNKKTKSILELQKQWEAIGGLPREHAKEVNRKFWGAFKGFFHNKGSFFKKLEGERVTNLKKKQELVEQANVLKDNTNWNETAEKLKALQKEWRDIGPVPEKFRNSVYAQFKEACDVFFNNRRSQNKELEKDYQENLKKKQQLCAEIEGMVSSGNYDLDKFLDLKAQFTEIGFVPASQVKQIRTQFTTAANEFLASVPEDLEDEARQIKYDIQFEKLKKGPHADRRKDQKQQALRRDIGTLENDIATWKNNLEFFANSKTANKLKEEFTVKIEQAVLQLGELKSQLRALREL